MQSLGIRGKTLLSVAQGGMGVGDSAHRLAGSVAAVGALDTICSVALRPHHEYVMHSATMPSDKAARKAHINQQILIALDREIKQAKALAQGRGAIAVNVMKAVSAYPDYVRQACLSGADAIVVGAGLPLDLPELTRDFPEVALIPILSDARD